MKKHIVAATLLAVMVSVATAGVAGFLTQKRQGWGFIQAVGGMKVSAQEKMLHLDCDVSGLRKVTLEPVLVNSGMVVRTVKHQRAGKTIQLSLITSVIEKGKSTSGGILDLTSYPNGVYAVQYLDPDGKVHPLGQVTLKEKGKR